MPRLPASLPASLGLTSAGSGLYTRAGIAYNYAIGGLPFLSAASREHPIMRETAQIRKEQFDNQPTPGEQSLSGWWIRSQTSFHGGGGQLFADPTEDNQYNGIRFRSSRNINPWEAGKVTLLNSVRPVHITPTAGVVDMTEINYGDGTAATFGAAGNNFVIVRADAVEVIDFTSSTALLTTATTDGSHVYVSTADGVWSAPIPVAPPGTWTWTKTYTIAANTRPTFMAYVKARLILTVGPAVYELAPHPAAPPVALPTAKYTSPDANWLWSGVTETSNAIYVVGNNRVRGSIIKFVMGNDGEIPTLTGGAVAAQLPFGEVPYSAIGYLGSYVGIGTNKGVRVGVADDTGNITYGPILFASDAPVRAWTARDRFLWCTVSRGNDGDSGLYRIDLSLQVADLRFPYAADLVYAGDLTDCNAVANLGASDLTVFATTDNLYIEDPSALAASGYLQTSRIRYSTLEPKLFKLIRVRGPALVGPLAFVVLDQYDSEASTAVYPEGEAPGEYDATISNPVGPSDFISLRFVLTRDDLDPSAGGELWAYQVKALPGGPRQRLIQLPMLCYDWEQDNQGLRVGGTGQAFMRLNALEHLEASGESVMLQDFDTATNTPCVIERLTFTQSAPPPRAEGWGGIVTITLRTI